MKIKRKASDSIETDAQIKEVYTEKVEEICNESLHSNIEYFQDIGDDNGNLEAEKLADQLKYELLKTHTRLLKVFKFPLRQVGPANVLYISLAFIRSSIVYYKVDVSC